MARKILILLGILSGFALAIHSAIPQNPLIIVSSNGTAGVAICYPSPNVLCYGYSENSIYKYPPGYSFIYTYNLLYSAESPYVYISPSVFVYGYSYTPVAQVLEGHPLSSFGFFGINELNRYKGIPPSSNYTTIIIFGKNATQTVYYIGIGSNPGYYTFSMGVPYNITTATESIPQQNISNYTIPVACYAPIVSIISPANNSYFYAGQTFTLQIQNNPQQLGLNLSTIAIGVYLNGQLYINSVFTPSVAGKVVPFNVTIISPGTYNITALVSYQYSNGCVNSSAASIIINVVTPPSLQITSIQPTATVPFSIGYPIINSDSATIYFILTGYVSSPTQVTCTATANLVSACGPISGSTSTSNSITFTYSGTLYNGQIPINLTGLTQGVYNIQLTCNVGGLQLSASRSILYAYNASSCNLYCKALGGYPGQGTCCGLTPGQAVPSMVTGYPNATYFNSSKCSIEPIPQGLCTSNKDVPPAGYICLNSSTVAYVQYYCTVNVSPIDPPTFGTINQTIMYTFDCPSVAFCSYGRCVTAPISPQLIINVKYPTQGQTVRTVGGSINVTFYVNDTIEPQVSCFIVSNKQIVTQGKYITNTEYNVTIPVEPGTNTLVITCTNAVNVTNSTTITFNVQTGYIPQAESECGIPYVCLSSTLAAVVNYSIVNGQCAYNIVRQLPAQPGQYCFAGSLYNEADVSVTSLLYANECGPDAISIYQYALTPTLSGTVTSMYLLQVSPYRCVLGNAVNQSQLASFNGMIIPVCTPEGNIAEYQIVYDNSTGRIYYQLQDTKPCSGTCVAGLCFSSLPANIQPPQLQSILVPSNYTNPYPVTFTVYSPYKTVYVTITYQTSTKITTLYSGVIYSGQTVNVGLNLPRESGILTITAEDPSGLSSSYQYQITITSENVTVTPIGPAPSPIVPSAPAAPITPAPAAIAVEASPLIAGITLGAMAVIGATIYILRRRGIL
jgi:hypothetical protein